MKAVATLLLLLLPACLSMLLRRLPMARVGLPLRRFYSDAGAHMHPIGLERQWRIHQKAQPFLKTIIKPLAEATNNSPWFHDTHPTASAVPAYLVTYSEHFRTLHRVHSMNLALLAGACRSADPDALKDWIGLTSSINNAVHLPLLGVQILQVYSLDLLAMAWRASSEERQAVAEFIELNLSRICTAHHDEVHRAFVKAVMAQPSDREQMAVLDTLSSVFIARQLLFAASKLLRRIHIQFPRINVQRFGTLWMAAGRKSLFSPELALADRIRLQFAYYCAELESFPDSPDKWEMLQAGQMADELSKATAWIGVYLEQSDRVHDLLAQHQRSLPAIARK